MADFNCPECDKPLSRKARKDGTGYFWGCTGYPDCKFIADDWEDEPFIHTCCECGERLKVRISKKTNKPYIACMNKEKHESGDFIFYNSDGTKRDGSDRPKPKGEFTCPECGEILKYYQIKKGSKAGQMGFACFHEDKHREGKALFWDDNGGRPIM